MATVESSVFQKSFGEWHDRLGEGPVEITRYGRTTAVLLSAGLFNELWASYRRALPVEALSPGELDLVLASKVEGERYELDDIPDTGEPYVSGG